jgi:GntR family histidine utilization transcriptional repressor
MSSTYSTAAQPSAPMVVVSPLAIARQARQRMVLLVLALLLLIVMLLCAGLGAYRIDPWQLPRLLWSGADLSAADAQARAVLLDIRMPRVLLAVLVGCGFGAAGSALQALFRNPLADPGLIGVSSGAALGAATTIVLGGVLWPTALSVVGIYAPMLAAFAGALAVALLVYRIGAAKGSGTYVAPGKYQSTLVEIRSIDDELVARGHRYRSQVLTLEASTTPVALKALGLENGPAFHSVIVHFADDIPIQLEDRYTNPQLFPDYLQQDFHLVTPNHYMVQIAPLDRAEYSIESKMPEAAMRKLLQMEAGEPCLLLSRRTWVHDTVATSVTLWHPGSRYQFTGGF